MPTIQSVFVIDGEGFCCATGIRTIAFTYKYREGSVVYSLEKSQTGIMEAVGIKTVKLVSNLGTLGRIVPLYIDNYNQIWKENMLCTQATARATAIAYLQQEQAKLLQDIESCK